MNDKKMIEDAVHRHYWENDFNCARTTMKILSKIFDYKIRSQLDNAAIGMHGAGRYGAQCGLVEGTLLFLGCYLKDRGYPDEEIERQCYTFARSFEKEFGSLLCRALRPIGFSPDNPPHACEELTVRAVEFSGSFIKGK